MVERAAVSNLRHQKFSTRILQKEVQENTRLYIYIYKSDRSLAKW